MPPGPYISSFEASRDASSTRVNRSLHYYYYFHWFPFSSSVLQQQPLVLLLTMLLEGFLDVLLVLLLAVLLGGFLDVALTSAVLACCCLNLGYRLKRLSLDC